MASRPDLIERFDRVATVADADLQVARAFEAIQARAGLDAGRLFAYPYGQVSDFLADEYFPKQRSIVAAFGAVPRPLLADSDPWRLPRYVCGPDFRSNGDLQALLTAG
jgi:hypothetical protein